MAKSKRSVKVPTKTGQLPRAEIENAVKAVHVLWTAVPKGWAVMKSGASRISARFDTHREAVEFARDLSRKEDSPLIVHGRSGNIQRVAKKDSPKGKSVRVTFELPAEVAEKSAAIVGNFNEWDASKGEMKLDEKKGVWTKSLSFKPGETVEFRYFVDESQWLNDEQADEYKTPPFFNENSVLAL